jgi:hypothetical protein
MTDTILAKELAYRRGLEVCDERHPINDRGIRRMTKADIIGIVGELAAERDTLAARLAAVEGALRDAEPYVHTVAVIGWMKDVEGEDTLPSSSLCAKADGIHERILSLIAAAPQPGTEEGE